jgi:hypothetical protein
LCYVTQLYKGSFPNTKFKNSSTQEIENIIKSIHGKISHKYDEISTKVLKFSAVLLASPLITFAIEYYREEPLLLA